MIWNCCLCPSKSPWLRNQEYHKNWMQVVLFKIKAVYKTAACFLPVPVASSQTCPQPEKEAPPSNGPSSSQSSSSPSNSSSASINTTSTTLSSTSASSPSSYSDISIDTTWNSFFLIWDSRFSSIWSGSSYKHQYTIDLFSLSGTLNHLHTIQQSRLPSWDSCTSL